MRKLFDFLSSFCNTQSLNLKSTETFFFCLHTKETMNQTFSLWNTQTSNWYRTHRKQSFFGSSNAHATPIQQLPLDTNPRRVLTAVRQTLHEMWCSHMDSFYTPSMPAVPCITIEGYDNLWHGWMAGKFSGKTDDDDATRMSLSESENFLDHAKVNFAWRTSCDLKQIHRFATINTYKTNSMSNRSFKELDHLRFAIYLTRVFFFHKYIDHQWYIIVI